MRIIICLDNANGLTFNGRRLSRDRAVTDDIVGLYGDGVLCSEYSAALFDGKAVAADGFLENAGEGDICFCEQGGFEKYIDSISEVTVYRWNMDYPSDVKLADGFLDAFELTDSCDFAGNSHAKITREVYSK